MNKIKLVLAGTASFSAKIFESLLNNPAFEVVALISQPNKEKNRQKELLDTEVAKLAKLYHVRLFQPNKIKEIYDELANLEFDFFITAAFGQFIPNSILKLPKNAAINVHGSLLEKYRGAAPIQHALLNDDKETGISLIYMIDKMDAGNIIKTAKCQIDPEDTALEVFDKLANLTIANLANWIQEMNKQKIAGLMQDENKVTFANKITNEQCELFSHEKARDALNKIRAFNDQPGAFIFINNKRLKIYRATLTKIKTPLSLQFADAKLYLIEYQFEGKKKVRHEI
ncbi:methionyl-tRNA formyltransferase [[Mycoplasma] anseris]|uniref:methionyl-tRNA formyltransferase n=1 Tax=[Mycoplasma] anseris TaxID=92400 RepID=A0A2Z4NCN5_9BACT|nr:methionyl-tRNA formyltransferase [[Mycoplasma] anseris]AWX69328.1 methionyl-tRNA formyltransferase [[Mycoplasma] anseris]